MHPKNSDRMITLADEPVPAKADSKLLKLKPPGKRSDR